jgi:hypothetical protein
MQVGQADHSTTAEPLSSLVSAPDAFFKRNAAPSPAIALPLNLHLLNNRENATKAPG